MHRRRLRYYDSLFYSALQYGADAGNVIEVGCSSDPFIQHLGWIDRKTCLAPYFIEYTDGKSNEINDKLSTSSIAKVKADFMEYELPNNKTFDLLLCNQVLEHVHDPAAFMKKLIATAKTSIISVPHNWPGCGKVCNHLTNRITYDMLMEWGKLHKPIYRGVVTEDGTKDPQMSQRIILVYKNERKEEKGPQK